MTRRSLIASSLVAGAFFCPRRSFAQDSRRPEPVALDYGLEIRDYRIFPTLDVTRFIVEIHNTTDEPMDMPAVGFTLPHLPVGQDFGFAGPTRPILYPHTSGALIGVAPDGLRDDEDWGVPDWIVCGKPTKRFHEAYDIPEVEVSYRVEVINDDAANLFVTVTNRSDLGAGYLPLFCDVYDQYGRICGILLPIWWGEWLEPGVSHEFPFFVWRGFEHIGNPFWLDPDLEELSAVVTVQPPVYFLPFVCPSVFPWNRE